MAARPVIVMLEDHSIISVMSRQDNVNAETNSEEGGTVERMKDRQLARYIPSFVDAINLKLITTVLILTITSMRQSRQISPTWVPYSSNYRSIPPFNVIIPTVFLFRVMWRFVRDRRILVVSRGLEKDSLKWMRDLPSPSRYITFRFNAM